MALSGGACSKERPATEKPPASYLERYSKLKTQLIARGPAPQEYEPLRDPPGARVVSYPSGALTLQAFYARPEGSATVPAVVYLHGGFALAAEDFEDARPFLNAGYALMMPALRGENGNPGTYEMFLGEVEDAKAAIAWLASQPGIDRSRVYAFGHSVGGNLAALLSLHDVPIVHSGGSGGVYDTSFFEAWIEAVPFKVDAPDEVAMRLLIGNTRWMKRPHYAFMGSEEPTPSVDAARQEVAFTHAPLTITVVEGDHFTAVPRAIHEYLAIIDRR